MRRPASETILVLGDGRTIALSEAIGRGGIGEVRRGILESAFGLRRSVAVKTIDVSLDDDVDDVMGHLRRIARRAVSVRHPSIVETIEIGLRGRQPFVVMELVEGESLASILATWREAGVRPPVDFALVVGLRIAEALGAALFTDDADGAPTRLAHGDLSPSQVLVSSGGEVKVGDFGQAALRERTSGVRARGRVAYTAPEVAHGLEPDARADVFSLGVVLHEMLVGPRFAPGTPPADMMKMARTGSMHKTLLAPNLPRELRGIVLRALTPRRGMRYAHARALAFDLRREALRMGLSDAQTSVRHAVVGWCEVPPSSGSPANTNGQRPSEVVPRFDFGDSDTDSDAEADADTPAFVGYDLDDFEPPLSSNG